MLEPRPPLEQDDAIAAMATEFSEIARVLFDAHRELDTLNHVVELAAETIEGVTWAASSSPMARP